MREKGSPERGFFGFGRWGFEGRFEKGGKRAIFDKVAKNVDLEQFYTDSDHSLYEFRPGTI